MGRRAKNKQAPPLPLPGSALDKPKKRGKKASSLPSTRDQYKAVKGVGAKGAKDRQKRVVVRDRGIGEVDEDDSELDEALRPGLVRF